jgi:hypothetical protein
MDDFSTTPGLAWDGGSFHLGKLDEALGSDQTASNIVRRDDQEPEGIEKHRHCNQQDD